jgi:arabinogalactan endo-1,4-beta-galactosidase
MIIVPTGLLLLGLLAAAPPDPLAPPAARRFLHGADVSFLPQVEAGGGVFRAGNKPADLLGILRARGIDTVRLRLWHAPAGGGGAAGRAASRDSIPAAASPSTLAPALALAARARAAGCDVLLDLHFSDTWADPGRQAKPAAWAALAFAALADSVRAHVRDALMTFAAHGAPPAIVQLGNEITAGLLWDDGRVGGAFDTPAQWDNLAALLKAAVAGARDAAGPAGASGAPGAPGAETTAGDGPDPGARRPEIMLHLDRGGDNAGARRWLDNLIARGVEFDLIGLSYYPWWHGTLADLEANLADLALRYGKDLVVVETAYPWTLAWFDGTHNQVGLPSQLLPGYPATPEGQRAFLADLMAIVRSAPRGRGRGLFWWAPEWIATPRFGSAWENTALFDEGGGALPALGAFAGASADSHP